MFFRLCLAVLAPALLSAASRDSEPHWYRRNKQTIQKIYDLTVYPNNAAIIFGGEAAVPKGLFNNNATGRVSPAGEFFGFQDSIEYFWGLAPLPTGVAPNGVFSKATLVEFTSGCAQVAASTVYFTVSTLNADNTTGAYITTLKQVAFWHFDAHGAVLAYDAWVPNLNPFVDLLRGGPPGSFFSPQGMAATIQSVCGLQSLTCVGANAVYAGIPDCIAALSAKPFGQMDEAWGDNVCCRSIHVLLTRIRPEVHCAHVGPTGGGKCIDVQYNDVYFNDKTLFGKHDRKVFNCETYW